MLTSEEMARIEEDERRRHAEEQYRAEVRAKLQQPVESHLPPSPSKSSRRWSSLSIALAVLIGLVFVVIVANIASRSPSGNLPGGSITSPPLLGVRYVPKTDQIASGQILVRHGGFAYYRIVVAPEMRNPVVSGSFTASGGSGNDIEAAVADEPNYTNWINGHPARLFWSTQGKETTGSFELHLRPGIYYLALSNRYSAFTDKYVFLNASLNYQQAESR